MSNTVEIDLFGRLDLGIAELLVHKPEMRLVQDQRLRFSPDISFRGPLSLLARM
jgi:hypothetical protein